MSQAQLIGRLRVARAEAVQCLKRRDSLFRLAQRQMRQSQIVQGARIARVEIKRLREELKRFIVSFQVISERRLRRDDLGVRLLRRRGAGDDDKQAQEKRPKQASCMIRRRMQRSSFHRATGLFEVARLVPSAAQNVS